MNNTKIFMQKIKGMSFTELQSLLSELEVEKFKFRDKIKYGYPSKPVVGVFGNMKNLNKNIARVKNELHLRALR